NDVIVYPFFIQRSQFLRCLCSRGDDDHWNIPRFRVLLQVVIYFPPVQIRHHNIKENEFWQIFFYQFNSLFPSTSTNDLKALPHQQQAHEFNHIRLVFNAYHTRHARDSPLAAKVLLWINFSQSTTDHFLLSTKPDPSPIYWSGNRYFQSRSSRIIN